MVQRACLFPFPESRVTLASSVADETLKVEMSNTWWFKALLVVETQSWQTLRNKFCDGRIPNHSERVHSYAQASCVNYIATSAVISKQGDVISKACRPWDWKRESAGSGFHNRAVWCPFDSDTGSRSRSGHLVFYQMQAEAVKISVCSWPEEGVWTMRFLVFLNGGFFQIETSIQKDVARWLSIKPIVGCHFEAAFINLSMASDRPFLSGSDFPDFLKQAVGLGLGWGQQTGGCTSRWRLC